MRYLNMNTFCASIQNVQRKASCNLNILNTRKHYNMYLVLVVVRPVPAMRTKRAPVEY